MLVNLLVYVIVQMDDLVMKLWYVSDQISLMMLHEMF